MLAYFLPQLPKELEGLSGLARDMRWSWSHTADALWKALDPDLWESTKNPWILQTVSAHQLRSLASDPAFMKLLREQVREHQEALAEACWFDTCECQGELNRVAYFSMEFGLAEALPLYSGGLGILAGDLLKTASDLGVPVTGVGLLYQQGYFRQALDAEGRQRELFPYNDPVQLPILPVRNEDGEWIRVSIELPGRRLRLQLWQAVVGRVRLLLLDSNDPLNTPADRGITGELYGGSTETRLQQEMVLGIGGVRAVHAFGLEPEVFHLNEGHTAFAPLERARQLAEAMGTSFETALTATRAGNLFTTHTPVKAGFDRFSPELVREYLAPFCAELGIDVKALLRMGQKNTDDAHEPFKMTYLALRGAGDVNAVSRLHGNVSRRLFEPLFPRWPASETPVGAVTNGVHVPSWDSPEADELWTHACGKGRWRGSLDTLESAVKELPDDAFWKLRTEGRAKLVRFVHQRLSSQRRASGASEVQVRASENALDPEVLTVCFARRFAEYKRPDLLLEDPDRLTRLLTHPKRPVQLVLAGKAHPSDERGKELVYAWNRYIETYGTESRVVFLSDYDMMLAERLVQGADLWLNTPRRPWEASGTSGMKVLVNGGLNLSSLDGWWAEAFRNDVGWAIGDGREHDPLHDAADASELYEKLETEVVPMFYRRDGHHRIPSEWVAKIRASIAELTPRFSANRMLREYLEQYYASLARDFRSRVEDGARLAREIETWRSAIREHWKGVHIDEVHLRSGSGDTCHARAVIELGALAPDAVGVELFANGRESGEPERIALSRSPSPAETAGRFSYEARFQTSRPRGDYTLRVVPHHRAASIPLECHAILWQSRP